MAGGDNERLTIDKRSALHGLPELSIVSGRPTAIHHTRRITMTAPGQLGASIAMTIFVALVTAGFLRVTTRHPRSYLFLPLTSTEVQEQRRRMQVLKVLGWSIAVGWLALLIMVIATQGQHLEGFLIGFLAFGPSVAWVLAYYFYPDQLQFRQIGGFVRFNAHPDFVRAFTRSRGEFAE